MQSSQKDVRPINGWCVLPIAGKARVIIGGPFDSYMKPAIGVCLEAHSIQAENAAILIDVPDFKAPTHKQLTDGILQLIALCEGNDNPIYVGCLGGIGRTGTFIAALAKVAGIADPVGWTRHHYLGHAVETTSQRNVIASFDVEALRMVGRAVAHVETPSIFKRIRQFFAGRSQLQS